MVSTDVWQLSTTQAQVRQTKSLYLFQELWLLSYRRGHVPCSKSQFCQPGIWAPRILPFACHPIHNAPDPADSTHGWWACWETDPCLCYGLSPTGPHGPPGPRQQALTPGLDSWQGPGNSPGRVHLPLILYILDYILHYILYIKHFCRVFICSKNIFQKNLQYSTNL